MKAMPRAKILLLLLLLLGVASASTEFTTASVAVKVRGGNGFLAGSALASRRKLTQKKKHEYHAQLSKRTTSTSSSQSVLSSSNSKAAAQKQPPKQSSSIKLLTSKNLSLAALAAASIALAYHHRQVWLPFLDKKKIQDFCVQSLEQLRPADPNNWGQRLQAYSIYAVGMAFWEFLGLSTIPVETAAGMVFHWPAAVASAIGKLVGASIAFGIGRTYLQNYVQTQLKDNTVCQLLAENGHRHHPFLSASLMKFSCFPEFVKNFGTAAFLPSVQYPTFLAATCLHGVTFTLLWTWLGCETALYMAAESTSDTSAAATQTSLGLQIALIAMVLCGFVLSPLSMAWWVRDLQKSNEELHEVSKGKTKPINRPTSNDDDAASPKWAFWTNNKS